LLGGKWLVRGRTESPALVLLLLSVLLLLLLSGLL
jgi:hypothetical protein